MNDYYLYIIDTIHEITISNYKK